MPSYKPTQASKPIPFPHKQYGMYYIEEDLRDAAYRGDNARISLLIKQYPTLNLNATNEYGETALYIACKKNQDNTAKYLLDQPNIKIDAPTILGNSTLLVTAWNDNTSLAITLVEKGADVNARTKADRQYHGNVSALDVAKERGNTELTNYLQQKIEPNFAPHNRT